MPVCYPVCYYIYVHARLLIGTDRASLLGVKFGDSQMTSHAGGGDGNVWYKLVHANLLGWGLQSLGGEMKNNVNPITKTPWKGVPICRKTEY